jgi:hypothetical protein
MSLRRATQLLIGLLILTAGCSGRNEPRLDAWVDGSFQPRTLSAYDISGTRDGSVTHAVATFTLQTGETLALELEIVYNPTPSIGSSHWQIDGDNPASGDARSESLKFLGGQGEGPSLGGRFILEVDGAPRYRVIVPTRPVETQSWDTN